MRIFERRSHPRALGLLPSPTDTHLRKYPLTIGTPASVEHTMRLPYWHWLHDQGHEGACVGHGTAMERAIRELHERKLRPGYPRTVRFDPWFYWNQAKMVDQWPDTNPGDSNGTSVDAAYQVVRSVGGVRLRTLSGSSHASSEMPDIQWSVTKNEWASTVDQMRACIARDQPVTIGVNWYTNFDTPIQFNGEPFIGQGQLGQVRGGHCVCVYGASDRRGAFRVKNSWGRSYPLVWLSYSAMQRLLSEGGEATVVTDND